MYSVVCVVRIYSNANLIRKTPPTNSFCCVSLRLNDGGGIRPFRCGALRRPSQKENHQMRVIGNKCGPCSTCHETLLETIPQVVILLKDRRTGSHFYLHTYCTVQVLYLYVVLNWGRPVGIPPQTTPRVMVVSA